MWPSTSWPLSSLTRNIVLGKASVTSPSTSMVSSFTKRLADHRHVGRFHALLALLSLELDLLPLLQVPVARSGDVGKVDEEVGAAVLRGDEPEALRSREPFNCASSHEALSWSTSLERRRSRTHGPTRTSTSPTAGLTRQSVTEELRPIPAAETGLPGWHTADTRSGTSPPSAASGAVPSASPDAALRACSSAPARRPRRPRARRRRSRRLGEEPTGSPRAIFRTAPGRESRVTVPSPSVTSNSTLTRPRTPAPLSCA